MKKKLKKQVGGSPDYAERARLLRSLGYCSYSAYLDSPLWASIRERVLERDEKRCQLCGRDATQVHHRQYTEAVLRGKDMSLLAAICAGCHRHIEFDKAGRKRGAEEVGRIYRRLVKSGARTPRRRFVDALSEEFFAIVKGV